MEPYSLMYLRDVETKPWKLNIIINKDTKNYNVVTWERWCSQTSLHGKHWISIWNFQWKKGGSNEGGNGKKKNTSLHPWCLPVPHAQCRALVVWFRWFAFAYTQRSSKNMRLHISQLYCTNHANYLNHLNSIAPHTPKKKPKNSFINLPSLSFQHIQLWRI